MKNKFRIIDDNTIAIEINFKGSKYDCLIDKEDFDKVASIKTTWFLGVKNNNIESVKTKVQDNKIRKTFYIHNIIFNKTDPNNVVDHINHNPLDNRKCNLRELSKYDNSQNLTIKSKNSLKQKCIYYECNKYRVRIKRVTYGYFERLDDAISIIDEIYPKVYSTYSNQEER